MFKLLRLNHYTKNLFTFAPLFFSFNYSFSSFIDVSIVFVLFSLIASSIYVFNDLMDISEDRQHPTKRFRPLASGKISKFTAKVTILFLSVSSLLSSFFFSQSLFIILLIYFILNTAYSLRLKHITIIDIFIIATGFVLRLFAGSSVIVAPLSFWIIIITFLLALFLAIAKRRDDLLLSFEGKETRKNINGYNLEFVNAAMILMAGVVIVLYILYTVSDIVMAKLDTNYLFLTTFFVMLGILRYMQLTFVEKISGNPTKIVLKDRFLKITIVGWLASFIIIVKMF